ncbi:type II secretion system protein GspE [candidate division KSB1 bacterium]|nr:type IV-A pilus assembly ATPase PilB [bacterium]RKY80306.1 MAG: type II secretion system protein GspE [candidate division KSB1 bacterium]RKY80530.1 MAG: type II secretion system protein GspE [candidate division KSB1 bacterium]RKY87847.1 MAG: type II secretion system protein GspE [candidate division KSB1 bacterium]
MDIIRKQDNRFSSILLDAGLITKQQLETAQKQAQSTGQDIGTTLMKLGYITQEDMLQAIAEQLDIPYLDLENYEIDTKALQLVPSEIAYKYRVIPVFHIGNVLTLAMANPQDVTVIDKIRRLTKMEIEPAVATEAAILQAIEQHYGVVTTISETINEVIQTMEAEIEPEVSEKKMEENLRELAEDAPVVKLVNMILVQAIKEHASDIHIEPEEDSLRVRYRIDGILHEIFSPPKELQAAIISRIKILAEVDIAENRIPQDGRFRMKFENKEIDVRVSTLPTAYGENVVMRILDKSNIMLDLKDLGFTKDGHDTFIQMLANSYGIILVTGPTGSGKTTTLYAALNTINSIEKNIITVEDPIEYRLKLIRQSQVNPKAGLTFASGLRSILRQDPDVIMVGEIRDSETANIAIQAALTGHLVLSTLHTNDAAGALTRMNEMGVESFLLASATIGVLAQRLVRKICEKCKKPYQPDKLLLERIGITNPKKKLTFFRGEGCSACKNTGYRGRTGIYEILKVDDKIRELVLQDASSEKIRNVAITKGMRTLKQDGLLKCLQGITTIEEVMRVTNIA